MEILSCNASTNMLIVPHHVPLKQILGTQGRDMEARIEIEPWGSAAY